jgi:heme exporter protein B
MLQLYVYEIKLNLFIITLTVTLFWLYIITIPLLVGLSPQLLYYLHLGVIWICILFSVMTERFFQSDLDDGTLELFYVSNCPIQHIFICKMIANWCLRMIGILCSIPMVSIVYHLDQSIGFYITIIVGSLVLVLILGVYACLTLGVKSNLWHNLQHLITLPILLPAIMLCTTVQSEFENLIILVGYLSLFVWIYWTFISITLQNILSR